MTTDGVRCSQQLLPIDLQIKEVLQEFMNDAVVPTVLQRLAIAKAVEVPPDLFLGFESHGSGCTRPIGLAAVFPSGRLKHAVSDKDVPDGPRDNAQPFNPPRGTHSRTKLSVSLSFASRSRPSATADSIA